MAESITIKALQDASLDAKSLEEVVNGNDAKQVTTRLGETYPSVKKAIKTLFENGGLPATPFATKALMTASALADGKYAMVTDGGTDSGLYIKTAGAWVKSAYDPTTLANTYTDNKVKGVTNNFKTKALMTASALPNDSYAMVTEDTEANNGLYVKTAGAWVKSDYDPLTQAKVYTDKATNINIFRGTETVSASFNAVTVDKALRDVRYSKEGVIYSGIIGQSGFVLDLENKIRKTLNLWVKVRSIDTVGDTIGVKFLMEVKNKLGTALLTEYKVLKQANSGWVKMTNKVFTPEEISSLKSISVQPFVDRGATIDVEDFYIGEGSPLDNFIIADEPKELQLARATTRKSILPDWEDMPKSDGVTVNRDGDITIAAGKSYELNIKTDKAPSVHTSTIVMQEAFGDCRLFYTFYNDVDTQLSTIPLFPAMMGAEYVYSYDRGNKVSRVKLEINNFSTTSPITLKSFELCYNKIAPNYEVKNGEVLSRENITSRILKEVNSKDVSLNLSTAPNFEFVPKNENGDKVIANNATYIERASRINITGGSRYSLVLEGMDVTLNGGAAQVTFYASNTAGGSLGGKTLSINNGTTIVSLPTTAEMASLAITFGITGGAVVKAGRLLLVEGDYSDNTNYVDRYSIDETGTISSMWADPKLAGYTKVGTDAAYQLSHDDADAVLTIPNTAALGSTQGAMWTVKVPQSLSATGLVITFEAKTTYAEINPTKLLIRYYEKDATSEFTAGSADLIINKDGSWALNTIFIPKVSSGKTVDFVTLSISHSSDATAPLKLKRFIATDGYHNPYVHFIKPVSVEEASGLLDFPRLTDALAMQPSNVFSVGRQLFRPLTEMQSSLDDYELIGGRQDLPKRLKDKRYIDTKGYSILDISNDNTVYLRKGAALYRTTVDDLVSRCPMGTVVGGENRAVFDDAGLELVNAAMPNTYLRETGNGTLVALGKTTAHYSTDKGITWTQSTGYQDVKGEYYNGWGTHVSDNIVLTSGYKPAAPDRGTGRINYSEDDGKTFKTLLDIETSPFIDNANRGAMHIHSVKYDKWWKGVWVVMGDGNFTNPGSSVISNIWFITNPSAAVSDIEMISYNVRGTHWLNEQHTSIHLMQDCILFGSDANPTGMHRMARTKNVNAFRDEVKYINGALSHYGCTDYRHKDSLPMSVYFGKDGSTAGTYDIVYLTYDGVNFSEIHTEPLTSNASGSKVDSFAYPLDNHFIFERRGDTRFTGGNTWLVAGINYTA